MVCGWGGRADDVFKGHFGSGKMATTKNYCDAGFVQLKLSNVNCVQLSRGKKSTVARCQLWSAVTSVNLDEWIKPGSGEQRMVG